MLIGLIMTAAGLTATVAGLVGGGRSYATSSTGTVTAPTAPAGPYSDGQTITVSGTGFSTRSSGNTIEIIECADPDGTEANLPQDNTTCDTTTENPNTIEPAADGSFTDQYQITELNTVVSGGGYQSNIDCNATNYCVLWIGEDAVNNFTGSTDQPVAFSPPFLINPGTGGSGSASDPGKTTGGGPIPVAGAATSGATTTTAPSSTTAGSGANGSADVTAVDTSESAAGASTDTGSSASLAMTGPPHLLPWLVGIGLLMVGGGSLARRRLAPERS